MMSLSSSVAIDIIIFSVGKQAYPIGILASRLRLKLE